MKLLWNAKDGGPESLVWMWGIESKRFGSILLLKFGHGSREAFHTHAFNSISWLLKGRLVELLHPADRAEVYRPSFRPIITKRSTFHMVLGGIGTNWVLSLRGPWRDEWSEYDPTTNVYSTLTHGRQVVRRSTTVRSANDSTQFHKYL